MSRSIKYETYWHNVVKGCDINKLAAQIGKGDSTLRNYLTGQSMPPSDTIATLCDIFNIAYEEGKNGFVDAYNRYHNADSSCKATKPAIVKPVDMSSTKLETDVVLSGNPKDTKKPSPEVIDTVLSILYNNVSYEVFSQISNILKS